MEEKLKQEIQDLRSAQAESERAAEGGKIIQKLRNLLKCKVCHHVARDGGIAFAQCCGQIVGCGPYVQAWYNENDTCLLYRNAEGAEKTIPFRELDEILPKSNEGYLHIKRKYILHKLVASNLINFVNE